MHWRKSAWALIAWTSLVVLWLIASASATASGCSGTGGRPEDCGDCVVMAVAVILFLWSVVALPLAAFWYAGRTRGDREAPPVEPKDH